MENNEPIKKLTRSYLTLRIRRVNKGLEVYAKSARLEKFFSNDQMNETPFGKVYRLILGPDDSPINCDYGFFSIEKKPYKCGKVNLMFLAIPGLKHGVKVVFPGVFSREYVEQYVQNLTSAIDGFFKRYIKDVIFTIEVKEGAK